MQALPAGGAMQALQASEAEVLPLLAGRESEVGIAAVNGPQAVVIAGAAEAAAEVAGHFEALGRKVTALRVSHAFHSPLMEPMLEDYQQVAEGLSYGQPRLAIVSTVTGRAATAEELTSPEYWVRHVRQAVRYADALTSLTEARVSRFLELGPDGTLTALAQTSLDDGDDGHLLVPVLRKDRPETSSALSALAALFAQGVEADWQALFHGNRTQTVDLPTYAFQHRRYWRKCCSPVGCR
jgi:acyl transferase domain-containing protein